VTPLLAQLGFFSRQISFKIVEKKIVGISQYAYFNDTVNPDLRHLAVLLTY
jgi:hypothetical protein